MKRKTSTLPTRIYKYALRPPTANANLVTQSFETARRYYNQLTTIENRRRLLYRQARARIFPEIGRLEAEYAAHERALQEIMQQIRASKSVSRTRTVPAELEALASTQRVSGRNTAKLLRLTLEKLRPFTTAAKLLRAATKEAGDDPAELTRIASEREVLRRDNPLDAALEDAASAADAEASAAVKALRPTLYWGTYLLVEQAAKVAARDSPGDVGYETSPPHLLSNRVGVHWAKGTTIDAIMSDDTLMQIHNPPTHRQTPSGIWRPRYQHDSNGRVIYCVVRIRVGSTPDRKPVWAEFPLAYDRPVPPDARIKDAYVTRRPLRERNPWQYHLCLVLESPSFEMTTPGPDQEGSTSVNFGWRQLEGEGGLRVATVNHEGRTPTFVELPARWVSGFAKCRELQSLLDEKFEAVKKKLSAWIATHESEVPEAFLSEFRHLPLWKSQHDLCELTRYWQSHRLPRDADIYPVMDEWRIRYLHLHDWMVNQRRHLLRQREDVYRCLAKEIVTSSARVVLDTFEIAGVARRAPDDEVEEGGQAARYNRTLAAPGDLREAILTAARKYHCEVTAAPTANGTRRCNVCGHVEGEAIAELEHQCSECAANWDQDVNNTDNLLDASTSGEVVELVRPAEKTENKELQESRNTNYRDARGRLTK